MDRLDSTGNQLQEGDRVVYLGARGNSLHGLPNSDQEANKAQVGKEMEVEGLDDYGNVELEFVDSERT